MMSRSDILMISLSRFFGIESHVQRLVELVEPTSTSTSSAGKISLRLLDWFVTNYARDRCVVIDAPPAPRFDVYRHYRTQLKAYSKQQFDPFRRRDRIMFHYGIDKSIETTVGQLNFFRWVIENGVLDYVEAHVDEIEADMLQGGHTQRCPGQQSVTKQSVTQQSIGQPSLKSSSTSPTQRRRVAGSSYACAIPAATKMNRLPGSCTVSFD